MGGKKTLTDRTLISLKPAKTGRRYEVWDSLVPGFGVRVTDKGRKTFILLTRYPGSPNPTRRSLGVVGALRLGDARQKARDWLELIASGADPREREQEQRDQDQARQEASFAVVAEKWLRLKVVGPDWTKPKQRQGLKVAREVRRELIGRWGDRPLDQITKRDVIALVDEIEGRGTPAMARNVLGHAKTFFNWCIGRALLEHSPCDRVKLSTKKKTRKRVLNDSEIFAIWRASGRLGYPFGPMYRLLLLCGQRNGEVASARWREFHPEILRLLRQRKRDDPPIDWVAVRDDVKLWTVGAERFKSEVPQLVPLTDEACAVLETLPLFDKGDHLFSTTFGEKPVSGFGKAKSRLDARVVRTLRALARKRGENPQTVELQHYVIHDLRRTLRTRLSSLRVPDEVAEMCIGHGRQGLQRIYDQHKYEPEMRDAFNQWAARLRSIVDPVPVNVVRQQATRT